MRFNHRIISVYQDYCYYQLIKYSTWSISDFEIIKNKETAIERYQIFYNNCTPQLKEVLQFTDKLGNTINEVRSEEPDPEQIEETIQEEWMTTGENMPKNANLLEKLIDKNYDWIQHRNDFSDEILLIMLNWITKQKEKSKDNSPEEDEELPNIEPEQLNKLQRFTYDLVEGILILKKMHFLNKYLNR